MHDGSRFPAKRRDYIRDSRVSFPASIARESWRAVKVCYTVVHLYISGYGHSTPNTIYGKLFTMCYAIIGIPLGLVMFQSIGERLNKFSSVVIRGVKTLLNCRDVQVTMNFTEPRASSFREFKTAFRRVLFSRRTRARTILKSLAFPRSGLRKVN